MQHSVIHLWSGPRNISTALMYAFAQRNDTQVLDEPLYTHYLDKTGIHHPGREEILRSQNKNGNEVLMEINYAKQIKPVLFCKQMTHHLVDIDLTLLNNSFNILLIRDPAQVLQSYSKIIDKPILNDIGIKQNADLYHFLQENKFHCLVIDSNELLKNPQTKLENICHDCSIRFQPSMLKWKAGSKKEDGNWAKYWYNNVHRSTGFAPFKENKITLTGHLQKIYLESKPYYDFLFSKSLKA